MLYLTPLERALNRLKEGWTATLPTQTMSNYGTA